MTKKHALIIDDNLDNIDVLVELLTLEGLSSTAVVNPSDLKATIRQVDHLDIVFLDLEMPNQDGYKVLELLKDDLGIRAPVVAYTVHATESNTAHDLGFDSFLGKPLDVDRFPVQLARILNGEQVWEPR